MLKFTPEQEAAINAARSQFNANQEALAPTIQLVGNAAPVPLDAWRRKARRASGGPRRQTAPSPATERKAS